jgi:hypothetical protein
VDATTAESARDTAVLKAAEAAASAAIAGAALNADAWSASVNYVVGDVVYTTTGKTYRCIDPNINNNPDTDDGSDWFSMTLILGEASNTAYRGDRGKTAYDHSQVAHAPSDAQKNSDILKSEIEAKLIGLISSHEHTNCDTVDGYHAQKTAAADKIPVAGADGKLDSAWLPTQAPTTPGYRHVAGSSIYRRRDNVHTCGKNTSYMSAPGYGYSAEKISVWATGTVEGSSAITGVASDGTPDDVYWTGGTHNDVVFIADHPGVVTVYFEIARGTSGTAYARVTKNGTVVMNEVSTTGTTFVAHSVDVAVNPGDAICIQKRSSTASASSTKTQNHRLCITQPT